jgi:hypothetical protein
MTLDAQTLECSVRSERVNGSARVVRPLYSRRARGCTSGSAAKYISLCVTVSIAWAREWTMVRVGQSSVQAGWRSRSTRWSARGRAARHLLRVRHAREVSSDPDVVPHAGVALSGPLSTVHHPSRLKTSHRTHHRAPSARAARVSPWKHCVQWGRHALGSSRTAHELPKFSRFESTNLGVARERVTELQRERQGRRGWAWRWHG